MKNKILSTVLMGIVIVSALGTASSVKKTRYASAKTVSVKSNRKYIGISRARSIALSRVKGANSSHVRKLKLDYDDGRPVYEGEIRYNEWEYDFEIDAVNGRILKWDQDRD